MLLPIFIKPNKRMAKNQLSVYEKIELSLFKSIDESRLDLTDKDMEVKKRISFCVSKKMDNPLMQNSELVHFLMDGGSVIQKETDAEGVESETVTPMLFRPVSQAQAYNDIAGITKIFGNITQVTKAWSRYVITEVCLKGAQIAVEDRDPSGIAANMDKIGKYTRADKEDDAFDYSQMLPPSFEPTDDVTVLEGLEEIADLETERKAFRARFKGNMYKGAEEAVIGE